MSENKNFEELSAYLDGEASNPSEVKRRLDRDPDAARMANELSVLAEELSRLPAPDVHPAFRTRVMAAVRETPRASVLSWRWRTFAAMVLLVPFAAAIWTFWWSPPPIPDAGGDRAMIRYLLEQDEEAVLDQLAAVYADDLTAADDSQGLSGEVYLLDAVEESVWLDVLAMDATVAQWANTADLGGGALTDDELLEIEMLVFERMTGETTI